MKGLGKENGWSSEQALERVKAGEVVSRPAWEDIYTSMAPVRTMGPGEKSSTVKSVCEYLWKLMQCNVMDISAEGGKLTSQMVACLVF